MVNCVRCGYPPSPDDPLDDPYDGDECDCIPLERLEEYDTQLSPRAASRLVRETRRLAAERDRLQEQLATYADWPHERLREWERLHELAELAGKQAAQLSTTKADAAKLQSIMREALQACTSHKSGIHPHVVGCWIRHAGKIAGEP